MQAHAACRTTAALGRGGRLGAAPTSRRRGAAPKGSAANAAGSSALQIAAPTLGATRRRPPPFRRWGLRGGRAFVRPATSASPPGCQCRARRATRRRSPNAQGVGRESRLGQSGGGACKWRARAVERPRARMYTRGCDDAVGRKQTTNNFHFPLPPVSISLDTDFERRPRNYVARVAMASRQALLRRCRAFKKMMKANASTRSKSQPGPNQQAQKTGCKVTK